MAYRNDPELKEAVGIIKKRRNIYMLVWFVLFVIGAVLAIIFVDNTPVLIAGLIIMLVAGIPAGLAIFCINNIRYIKSDGRRSGGGILWTILLVLGLIVVPIIVVQLCAKIEALGWKVIGA